MRRLLVLVLLALLPIQFSWAAVASYRGHEAQASTGHASHHAHAHSADAGSEVDRDPSPEPAANDSGDQVAGAMDLDCGHCHGSCSMMLVVPLALSDALATAPPGVSLDEARVAHASPRPERPQWLPLA